MPSGAKLGERGEAIAGSIEGFAHVAGIRHGFGECQDLVRRGIFGRAVKELKIFGEVLSSF